MWSSAGIIIGQHPMHSNNSKNTSFPFESRSKKHVKHKAATRRRRRRRRTCCCFSIPFRHTHAAPPLAVIRRLASFTPNTIYSFFNTAKSNASNFTPQSHHHSYPNFKACDIGDGTPEDCAVTGNPLEEIELFLLTSPRETGRKVSCLVTDAFLWFAADIAKQIQVPWLAVWNSCLTSLSRLMSILI